MSGFSIELTDNEEGSTVDVEGISATFDGVQVEVNASKSDGVTSFNHETPELLLAGTEHTVQIVINDEEGAKHVIDKVFKVKAYTVVDVGSKASESLKGEQGIAAYITQISQGQGVGNLHGNQIVNAEKAFNGWGIDINTEEPFLNEADPDSFEGWSYFPVLVDVVNMNQMLRVMQETLTLIMVMKIKRSPIFRDGVILQMVLQVSSPLYWNLKKVLTSSELTLMMVLKPQLGLILLTCLLSKLEVLMVGEGQPIPRLLFMFQKTGFIPIVSYGLKVVVVLMWSCSLLWMEKKSSSTTRM